MKVIQLIILFFYTVYSKQNEEGNFNYSGLIRHKRQENRWVWGDVPESTTTTKAVLIKSVDDTNPCMDKTYSPKPDFSALGKRLSDAKCYEYIWELKRRDEIKTRSDACVAYRRKLGFGTYVISGRLTKPAEFPHMGAIGWKAFSGTWVFKCGSSLISPKFVLTAAHCSSASSRDTTIADIVPQIVRLGDKNILDTLSNGFNPIDKKIIRIIVHPEYASPMKYFDIALMELENDVEFYSYIQPACLWSRFDTSLLGSQATLTGWGVVETAGLKTSPELLAGDVDVIDQQKCDELLRPSCNRNWCGVKDTQICAGKLAGGIDACQGDSGGPLQMKIPLPNSTQGSMHYIIGVTSFGIGCGLPNLPGIYTRTSSFIDWIEKIVWQ